MGYYMRYIVTDERPVTVQELADAFRAADPGYHLEELAAELTVHHGARCIAHLTFNVPGDGLFDEEREELLEEAGDARGKRRQEVVDTLRAARQIVAVQVLHGGEGIVSTLDLIDPLWEWLRANRTGIIQADAEGYYVGRKLVLAVR
jgi:hypothetical protein